MTASASRIAEAGAPHLPNGCGPQSGWRGLFEVPSRRSLGRNEFHSRADERLSAVEPKRLSRAEVVTCVRLERLMVEGG